MEKNIVRKLLCLFLTATMLFSLCPAAVFAGEADDELILLEEYEEAYACNDEPDVWYDEQYELIDEEEPIYQEEFLDEVLEDYIDEPEIPVEDYEEIIDENGISVVEAGTLVIAADDLVLLEEADLTAAPAEEKAAGEADGKTEQKAEKEESEEEAKPGVFPGLPEDYMLPAEKIAQREEMAAHGIAAQLENLTPDEDYIEGELWFLADDEEYALLAAEAYGAELVSFEYGVGVLRLDGATVLEAVAAAEDLEQNLPPVSPNYIVTLEPRPAEEISNGELSSIESYTYLSRKSWEYWHDYYGSSFDPFLRDPTASAKPDSNQGMSYQYMHDLVNSYDAWGVTTGSGVLVAVLDSGVANHEDLPTIQRIVVNSQIDQGSTPGDPNDPDAKGNHGTHVAGTIGERLGNAKGGAGIAPNASLLSIQVTGSDGKGSNSDIIKGINAAVSAGANVINLSLGTPYWDSEYESAVRKAVNAGVTVVCSAGNSNSNTMNYPGSFDIPGVICVGSVSRGRTRSGFSNYGSWVDVYAPGSDIWSTVPGNHYASYGGTSMATPVVSGACALYLSRFGYTDPVSMEKIIKASVTDGVLDVSKFFEKDKSAPAIKVSGLTKNTAPYGAALTFSMNPGDTILYTLNGKNPGLKDGYPNADSLTYSGGTVYLDSSVGAVAGKKFTIKAVRVNGMGEVSATASVSLTLGYASPSSVSITDVPSSLIAGKSVTLKAVVSPATADQSVVWSIVSQPNAPGASIDAKSGKLSTKATDSGTIQVRATASGKSTTARIKLSTAQPVKKLVLSLGGEQASKLTLHVGVSSVSKALTAKAYDQAGSVISGVKFAWSSSNAKVATVNSSGTVTPIAKGTTNITCTAMDGSGVSAKCAVTVAQDIVDLWITGPNSVTPGKSVTLKANIRPADASSKTVDWSVDNAAAKAGVTVKGGKLTVPASFRGNSITVTAKATDGGGAKIQYGVSVNPTAGKISLYLDDSAVSFYGGGYEKNKDGTLKSITLHSVEQDYYEGGSKHWVDSQAQLTAVLDVASDAEIIWTSSNENVVSVYDGHLYAIGPGSATVTAKVNDAGGKKASVSVKVIIPVSSVTVVSALPAINTDRIKEDDYSFDRVLGVGKSAGNKAVLGDAFGKPTNGKVQWELKVSAYHYMTHEQNSSVASDIKEQGLVKLSSTGTLSTSAKLSNYANTYDIFAKVTAYVSGDGTWVEDSCVYYILPQVTKIGVRQVIGWNNDIGAFVFSLGSISNASRSANAFNVTSSNLKACSAVIDGSYLLLFPNNRDLPKNKTYVYTTIKVTACDGSGKSMNFKVGFAKDYNDTYYWRSDSIPWI